MKKLFTLCLAIAFITSISSAQTTAMDFNMNDCNGTMHNLYSELDQEKVVILEFFMTNCNPCITAGNGLNTMRENLLVQYPGQVLFFQFPFNNSTNCTVVSDWVTSHGYNSVAFDSGAAQVAYYGGFGMPTVVVVAGSSYEVLYNELGFTTKDTQNIAMSIHDFFNMSGISDQPLSITSFTVYPNPASGQAMIQLQLKETTDLQLQLTDLSGKVVSTIFSGTVAAGKMEQSINTAAIADGLYLVKAMIGGKEMVSKLQVAH